MGGSNIDVGYIWGKSRTAAVFSVGGVFIPGLYAPTVGVVLSYHTVTGRVVDGVASSQDVSGGGDTGQVDAKYKTYFRLYKKCCFL